MEDDKKILQGLARMRRELKALIKVEAAAVARSGKLDLLPLSVKEHLKSLGCLPHPVIQDARPVAAVAAVALPPAADVVPVAPEAQSAPQAEETSLPTILQQVSGRRRRRKNKEQSKTKNAQEAARLKAVRAQETAEILPMEAPRSPGDKGAEETEMQRPAPCAGAGSVAEESHPTNEPIVEQPAKPCKDPSLATYCYIGYAPSASAEASAEGEPETRDEYADEVPEESVFSFGAEDVQIWPDTDSECEEASWMGQPIGQPMGQLIGQPMGQPMGIGQPMAQPMAMFQPMGQPMGQPMAMYPCWGQPMGPPMDQPMGQPMVYWQGMNFVNPDMYWPNLSNQMYWPNPPNQMQMATPGFQQVVYLEPAFVS